MTSSTCNQTRLYSGFSFLRMRWFGKALTVLFAAQLSGLLLGQWVTNGTVVSVPESNLVGIGTATPGYQLDILSESSSGTRNMGIRQVSSDSSAASLTFVKARGSAAAPAAAAPGDKLGNLQTAGYDGSTYQFPSRILFVVDAPVTLGSVPTSMQFTSGSTGGGTESMRITSAGNVGIGTATPNANGRSKLSVNTGMGFDAPASAVTQYFSMGGTGSLSNAVSSAMTWTRNYDNINLMTLTGSGNLGIGTTNPGYPLSVHGTIQATEVLVNTGWSDYVFNPDYRLQPLSEVAAYVQENHHLPEIPSAAEVAEKGISLGDMQSKLLAKIEELTLHMIQAEKENHELKERLVRLEQSKTQVNQ
jgi:hypothetical protein